MKVHILNRDGFNLLVNWHSKTNSIEKDGSNCYISIHDYDQKEIKCDSNSFLNLWFDDVTPKDIESAPRCTLFTERHAKSIIDFCEQNKAKNNLIVHCSAGVSRSGAVGTFINDIWGEESYSQFHARHPWIYPNAYISRILNAVMREQKTLP